MMHRCRPIVVVFATALLTLSVAAAAAGRDTTHVVSSPTGGAGTVVLEPPPDRPVPRPLHRIVFSCVTPGLVTFSDRPCGPLPERREITVAPAAGRDGEAPSVAASRQPASRPNETVGPTVREDHSLAEARERTCAQLRHAVESLDRQMRAGYSAREAPRLWDRWREAREHVRESGC
jgi:hypothetical protein